MTKITSFIAKEDLRLKEEQQNNELRLKEEEIKKLKEELEKANYKFWKKGKKRGKVSGYK